MKPWKQLMKQTAAHLPGQIFFCGLMLGVFALMGRLDRRVLLGALVGTGVATLQLFLMELSVHRAAYKAAQRDAAGGRQLLRLSYPGRMITAFAILSLCAGSGQFHPLALAMPLAFTTPVLALEEVFRKKGEQAHGASG